MAHEDVELVVRMFGPSGAVGGEIDMAELFADPDLATLIDELISDDAVVEFATPYGGLMGPMGGPFRGAEGLRRGWAEWLEPWESFVYRPVEWIDVGDGRVLTLGESAGRLGSGVEVDTPVGALYTVREGTITRIEHFLDQDQARRAAGLPG